MPLYFFSRMTITNPPPEAINISIIFLLSISIILCSYKLAFLLLLFYPEKFQWYISYPEAGKSNPPELFSLPKHSIRLYTKYFLSAWPTRHIRPHGQLRESSDPMKSVLPLNTLKYQDTYDTHPENHINWQMVRKVQQQGQFM